MRNDLLLKIADHVETVSPDSLVMNVWLGRGGTIGCAIGHSASILPELEWKNCVLGQIPFFNKKPGIEGVAELLEIEFDEARCLFLRSYYTSVTPQIIADRIRDFVKERDIVKKIQKSLKKQNYV